jgi:hypothetical protein
MNELHFAVCVGIDRYPGFPRRDLGSARGDAEAFRDWLLAEGGGGLPPDNMRLVTASPEETWPPGDARPQQREINKALNEFNNRLRAHLRERPEDWPRTRLYIYGAGHGIGPPDGECAVLMADAEIEMLGNNIELSEYREWYRRSGLFHEVVIFADCCREIGIGTPLANRPPFSERQDHVPPQTVGFTGYATGLGGVAFEPIDPWQPADAADRDRARGYFTRVLLDGLRGGTLGQRTGSISSTALAEYVQSEVEKLTRDVAPFPQEAEFRTPSQPIVFSVAPSEPTRRRVTIRFPAGFTGTVGIEPDPTAQPSSWSASDGPWEIAVPDGLYWVKPVGRGDMTTTPAGSSRDWIFKVVGADTVVQL